jgi:hypothetical protein
MLWISHQNSFLLLWRYACRCWCLGGYGVCTCCLSNCSSRGKRVISSPEGPYWLWWHPFPPSFLFSGYLVSFLGIKNLEYEVDHSPPPNTEVKNEWSYTSTPPTCLHAKHRVSFDFTLSVISFYKLTFRHCVLYIRTGFSLHSRERFLYI